MKQKILHVGKFYKPIRGGIETVTSDLCESFVQVETEVTVVTFGKSVKRVIREDLSGVQVLRCPTLLTLLSQPISITYLFWVFIEMRKNDIIHFHYPNIIGMLPLIFLSRKQKLLVHWHSDVVSATPVVTFFVRILEILLLKKADKVVATSEEYANSSKSLQKFAAKTVVVPIGISENIPPTLESVETDGSRQISDFLSDHIGILFVGRLVPYKGVPLLLKLLSELDERFRVLIIGDGPDRNQILRQISALEINDRCMLLGEVSEVDLSVAYNLSEIFCLPSTSRAEAFGVVLLEAMQNGLVLIVNKIVGSGANWVNNNGVSGLNLPLENAKLSAQEILRLVENTEKFNLIKDQARTRYTSLFTRDKMVEQFIDIYNELLSTR